MKAERLRAILDRLAGIRVLVLGDFFLDKYLDIDPALNEPSLETGLEAYQVVGVRRYPGAAGTVASNLRALGVSVVALGVVGDDGEGDDLRRALDLIGVDGAALMRATGRFTPTYLKPMLKAAGGAGRELNRFDTKNHIPLPARIEARVIGTLRAVLPDVQGVVISDQVGEANCGVITERVRAELSALARAHPAVPMLADSRERIGDFRDVMVKPNAREAARATGLAGVPAAGRELLRRTQRPVAITAGEQGMFLFDPDGEQQVAGITVSGPIDVVGAGDSAMAGLVSGLCAGASLEEAAFLGNLAASITIQQLGVTGTASPAQLLSRLAETNAAPG